MSVIGSRGRAGGLLSLFALFIFLASPGFARAGDLKGKVHIAGGVNNANAVVYIEKVDSTFAVPDTPAVMDQKNLMFTPEVLPVLAGTKVKFLNSDEVLHNVFTPSPCAGSFNLGSFPSGESKSHVFENAGCAALILCDIHPEMQAWIVVLQNPYFAVTDRGGNYIIKGVPAGTYNLKAWFGYYKTQTVRVVVPESGSVSQEFQLKQ
ncbi:MAG: hypothetical protein B7Z63_01265 [Ignavibacteriae bacterium 37-53-5]|nr:MAG: hypothetical protein B7Z63_01265 [Ignavibacteriae bacterium 37-53-5]